MKTFNPATYKYTPQLLPRQSKQTGKRFEVQVMYNRQASIDSGKSVYIAFIQSMTLTNTSIQGEASTPQGAADAAMNLFDRLTISANWYATNEKGWGNVAESFAKGGAA